MDARISNANAQQFLTLGFGAIAIFFALCVAAIVA